MPSRVKYSQRREPFVNWHKTYEGMKNPVHEVGKMGNLTIGCPTPFTVNNERPQNSEALKSVRGNASQLLCAQHFLAIFMRGV